jgi:acetoin utilization deacetylase AcuC-like enzyme
MLADGSTTLRAHLERVPTLKAYVLGGPAARQAAEVSEDLPFTRHHCCPMLRPSGELAVKYDGSVREGHKVRRDLLLMGFSIADVSACRAAGCVTLDSCCDWLSERTRATWSEWAHLSVAGEPTASVAVAYDMSADLHHPSTDGRVATSTVEALEGPQRVHGTLEVLARSGLLAACRVLRNSGRVATREELERVHEPSHVDLVLRGDAADSSPEAAAEARRALLRSCGVRGEQTADGDREDVYIGPHTMRAARSAAGVAIDLVERIVRNEIRAGVSVMRPAGHHAGRASIGGGCFVNSVAAAASAARVSGVERVLIVDLDVHHGDGTQEIFYADPSVLTISIHSIEHLPGAYYPPAGLPAHVGSGDARGRNVNVAFTYADGGYGDADYALAFELLVLPIARAFEPQLVIVAAGYDSVRGDPLGGFDLTAQGYAHLIAQLSQLARGKMLVSLEGGYSVTAQAGAMHECVRTLLAGGGAPGASLGAASAATTTAAPPSSPPKDAAAQCIAAALRCQAPHWVCLAGWEAKKGSAARPTRRVGVASAGPRASIEP